MLAGDSQLHKYVHLIKSLSGDGLPEPLDLLNDAFRLHQTPSFDIYYCPFEYQAGNKCKKRSKPWPPSYGRETLKRWHAERAACRCIRRQHAAEPVRYAW